MEFTGFDIETSGLMNDSESFVSIIGMLDCDGMRQFTGGYADFNKFGKETEKRILTEFLLNLPKSPILTYNGLNFDVPFLKRSFSRFEWDDGFKEKIEYFYSLRQLDIAKFCFGLFGRKVSKDEACWRICGVYMPRTTDGFYTARTYNCGCLEEDEHYRNIFHNSVDLVATVRMHLSLLKYSDYREFVKSEGFEL